MQITNDRRSRTRIPARGRAVVGIGDTRVRCACVDLSADGVGLLGPFAAASGTNVDLEFSVDGHNVSVRARVARAKRRPDGYLWGLRFDTIHAGQLSRLVSTYRRRIAQMRQARPFLDRLPRSGGAAWPTPSLAIQVDEPREATVIARAPVGFQAAPVIADDEPEPTASFDEEPTRVYYDPLLAAAEELEQLPADEDEEEPGAVAFESEVLAQLEERERELLRSAEPEPEPELEPEPRPKAPPFTTPPAPPVRRPVPTLAAPTISPAQLHKLFGDALAEVDRGRRRPRRRRVRL